MPLFRIKGNKAARILPQERKIREDVIHKIIEDNLETLFDGLAFVERKPRIAGKEFDTLAFDRVAKVPVIIEYKREKDRGVVEQVTLYYVKLKNNKSDVMIRLQKSGLVEDLGEVDFENPQIIVVAKQFTREQRELLTLMSDYLRLFTYQLYGDQLLSLEPVEPLGSPQLVSEKLRAGPTATKPYDLDHFGMKSHIRKVFEHLDKGITALDSRVKPGKINKYFVGYGATGPYFCTVAPLVNSIWIDIKCSRIPPSARGLKVYRVEKKRHTPMTHEFQISSEGQVDSAVRLIRTALEDSM